MDIALLPNSSPINLLSRWLSRIEVVLRSIVLQVQGTSLGGKIQRFVVIIIGTAVSTPHVGIVIERVFHQRQQPSLRIITSSSSLCSPQSQCARELQLVGVVICGSDRQVVRIVEIAIVRTATDPREGTVYTINPSKYTVKQFTQMEWNCCSTITTIRTALEEGQ